jgi:hypothetical protein
MTTMGKCKVSILNLFSEIYFPSPMKLCLFPWKPNLNKEKIAKEWSLVEMGSFSLQQPNLGPTTQEQTLHNKLVALHNKLVVRLTGFNDASSSGFPS